MLVFTILLALVWILLTGEFTFINFLFGLAIAGVLLWLLRRAAPAPAPAQQAQPGPLAALRQLLATVEFGLFFLWALILANGRVAVDVLRPQPRLQPAVVAVPLEGFTDIQMTLLANFITLTPGTLSLDIVPTGGAEREQRGASNTLYVHAMHAGRTQAAIDHFRSHLQATVGRRVQEVI